MKPDDRPPASRPATLGYLIREGKLLWLYCDPLAGGCGYEADVDPASLPLSPDEPVPTVGPRFMKCSKCGARKIVSAPELVPGGVVALRAKSRPPGTAALNVHYIIVDLTGAQTHGLLSEGTRQLPRR
jgi:hypothetical protein